ncbi:MAG: hypothetical protein LC650_02260 [Actinobacteria bacterium]|nr:hypothetical protein [Actinomycetota bacterium]
MNRVLGYDVRGIFDPVQTHCAENVFPTEVDSVKEFLKQEGATRFRAVKNGLGNVNLCFKMKKK